MKCEKTMPAQFTLQDMVPIAIILVVFGITISYGLSIMSDTKEDMCTGGDGTYYYNASDGTCYRSFDDENYSNPDGPAEYNATTQGIVGVGKIPDKMPTIGLVIAAVLIIGILVRYMGGLYTR